MIFSAAIKDRGLILYFVKIRLIDAHLFHEYFVRQSIYYLKFQIVLLLMDVVILVFQTIRDWMLSTLLSYNCIYLNLDFDFVIKTLLKLTFES